MSEGEDLGFGWHERKDYLQWIQFMLEKAGNQAKMVLFGVSMGGATVMTVSGEKLSDNSKVLVEDCGYSSVTSEGTYQLKSMYKLSACPWLTVTSLITTIRSKYWFGEAKYVEKKQLEKTVQEFVSTAIK
ncbi:hypothetical protein [Carnobacterium funditum]|uniref:hypothetical protein n=1 Tax=Carnobacterium funditum TaxID=2752 RepID=UPI00068F9487|nr:hypothetical protein [Carnobacterium funditum]